MIAKLWDGTTVKASCRIDLTAVSVAGVITLAGVFAAPAGNIRISVNDASSTSGTIRANLSSIGNTDSTLTVMRIG